MDECKHSSVEDGHCVECGLNMLGTDGIISNEGAYVPYHRSTRSTTLNFEQELMNLDISDRVREWVINTTRSAPIRSIRNGKRRINLCTYLYLAHLNLNEEVDPDKLALQLGLTHADLNKALKKASGIDSEMLPQAPDKSVFASIVIIPPEHYLITILTTLKLIELENPIRALIRQIMDLDESLYEEKPINTAIAIVKYYLDKNGRSYPTYYRDLNIDPVMIKDSLIKINVALQNQPENQK